MSPFINTSSAISIIANVLAILMFPSLGGLYWASGDKNKKAEIILTVIVLILLVVLLIYVTSNWGFEKSIMDHVANILVIVLLPSSILYYSTK